MESNESSSFSFDHKEKNEIFSINMDEQKKLYQLSSKGYVAPHSDHFGNACFHIDYTYKKIIGFSQTK